MTNSVVSYFRLHPNENSCLLPILRIIGNEMANTDYSRSVLVTGASGFVGGNLVKALLGKGYSVTCLVRKTSNTEALQKEPVRLVEGDLADAAAIKEAGSAITTVYHLAGAIKAAGRKRYFQANQMGTRLLLEALKKANPNISRFVYVSSLAAAGPSAGSRSLTEEQLPNPISWYGESKLAAEHEVLQFAKTFPVTILRPPAVYGPGDRETLLIFRMIEKGRLFSPGRYTRRFSMIHVDDLATGIIQAGECATPSGEIYFISRPEIYTWEEVAQAISLALGKQYRQISLPLWMAKAAGIAGDCWSRLTGRPASINSMKVRELLEPSWLCDSAKAQIHLGFSPMIDLENGMRQTVLWYQTHGWL
jgi:dihydroflavonol-4-reductase